MDFALAEEDRLFQETIRKFVDLDVAPKAEAWEEEGKYPREMLPQAASLGLLGLNVPEIYGGVGEGHLRVALAVEELARGSVSLASGITAHFSLGLRPIVRFGTDDQKSRYLRPGAEGKILGGMALTEPSGGSDVARLKTRAERTKGGWLLKGSKIFITNGNIADFLVVAARTGSDPGARGLSLFIVERGKGMETRPMTKKIGWHASDTAEIFFDGLFVPDENLLGGKPEEGFGQLMRGLLDSRIMFAAYGVGVARGAFERAHAYAQEREAFGAKIGSFEAVAFRLADMATAVETARVMVHRAAWMADRGLDCAREASMAKVVASEAASRVSTEAVRLHGGYGIMREYAVSRYFCDSMVLEIGEGTNDIQRMLIARSLGLMK